MTITVVFVLAILQGIHYCSGQLTNRAPHFSPGDGDMAMFSLPENTPVGTPVYQLKGIDPEGSTLHYSISGPQFSVDRDTGVIRLRQELDRETQDLVEVIISITDEGIFNTEPNTISLRREIPIRDYNDNPPVFHGRPYTANISESAPLGTIILFVPDIIVTDKDGGVNADVHLSCFLQNKMAYDDVCDVFDIETDKITEGRFKAIVTLKKALDFETRSSYILTLKADDGSSVNRLTTYATAVIDVIDVQDQPPVFVNAPYSETVAENTEAGTTILTILAADGDTGNPRPLLLTLEGDYLEYFELNTTKGEGVADLITSSNLLDREHPDVLENGGVYTFFVKATELINNEVPADSSVSQITIVITDTDDHLPVFNKKSFDIFLSENIENDTPIPGLPIFVTDEDLGPNSRYNLSIRNVRNAENVFNILPTYGEGRTPIIIKVKDASKLDYDVENEEDRDFIFDIVASVNDVEVAQSGVHIHLQDANDNSPIFPQQSYKFEVEENTKVGLKIGDISATDKDSGIYAKLEYSLKGFGADYFRTDKNTGGIYVNKNLDYERQKSYSLTLVARDGGGKVSTVNVFIDVKDLNDNIPYFELLEYTRTIREGATEFEPQLIIQATDLDGPDQGGNNLTYSLESINSIRDVFSVIPTTGEIVIKQPVSSMDTARGQYEMILKATDHGNPPLTNETRVLIRVGISGNQRPVFKGQFRGLPEEGFESGPLNYHASILENALPGQNVTQVIANDPDGQDSLLLYYIAGGAKDNFVIDERSGLLTVSTEARLDRDKNPHSYAVQVTAVDNGIPFSETATTTVFIKVEDVNDKPPTFNHTTSTVYVSERTEIGKTVFRVQANDTDLNSKLEYSIIEPIKAASKSGVQLKRIGAYNYKNAFKINKATGDIMVNNSLDYNQAAVITITVRVEDVNAEINKEEQFAITEITFYIQSYKDDNPIFKNNGWSQTKPTINLEIDEEIPIGTVLLELNAEDPLNGKPITSYNVLTSNNELVQVNEITGSVTLGKRLDYEALSENSLTFTVEAKNNDFTRQSVANVNLTVRNINDNEPMFEENEYRVSLIESAKSPAHVLTVKATDLDAMRTELDKQNGYGDVVYSINGEHASTFTIDPITGVIQIAANKSIDRETQSVLRFSVSARDSPGKLGDSKTSTALVVIDVLDVNDNSPSFELESYIAVIPENIQVGSSVINMTATDPDEGIGGQIKYEIVDDGDANGLLEVNSDTGEIKTRRQLTGKGRNDPYQLTIRAQDGGSLTDINKHLHSDVSLTLYVGDISANDGVPRFIKPVIDQRAFVSENASLGSPVFQVVASDPDDPSQPSGKLTYQIQDDTNDALSFKIDQETGLITTRRSLDRERKEFYSLILVVTDRGTPPQAATRVLQVQVTDIDDHTPRFVREVDAQPIQMSIEEEVQNGTVIGKFMAVDEDVGENAAIDYIIIDGNEHDTFAIERTDDNMAVIKSKQRLDAEETRNYLLTIKCFKYKTKTSQVSRKPYNKLDPSEIQVSVDIIDIDDHLPVFQQNNNVTLGIRLNVPVDTSLLTLKAVDIDSDAKPITYSIVNITFKPQIENMSTEKNLTDVFILNNATGEIRTGKSLINFVDGFFRLAVRANNSDTTTRYSDIYIQMYIVRDRSLLRFVFARPPGEVTNLLSEFTEDTQNVIRSSYKGGKEDVKLHVYDTQVLAKKDQSLDFSATSSCFQLTRKGETLTPGQMNGVLESLEVKQPLSDVFNKYRVLGVEECSQHNVVSAGISITQIAVLVLALLIGLAAFIACITVCCLHRVYKKRSKPLLPRGLPPEPFIPTPGPVMYAEPIYSTNTLQHSSL